MKCISTNCRENINENVWQEVLLNYGVSIRDDIKNFLRINNGGYPINSYIEADGECYEVRVFLSLDENDDNYYIVKPLKYFMEKTKGRIVPIGIDSGDNYYCVDNETGKVYYWNMESDRYLFISKNIENFLILFQI